MVSHLGYGIWDIGTIGFLSIGSLDHWIIGILGSYWSLNVIKSSFE